MLPVALSSAIGEIWGPYHSEARKAALLRCDEALDLRSSQWDKRTLDVVHIPRPPPPGVSWHVG